MIPIKPTLTFGICHPCPEIAMKRLLLNSLMIGSIVLFAIFAAAWTRGLFYQDTLIVNAGGKSWTFSGGPISIGAEWTDHSYFTESTFTSNPVSWRYVSMEAIFRPEHFHQISKWEDSTSYSFLGF